MDKEEAVAAFSCLRYDANLSHGHRAISERRTFGVGEGGGAIWLYPIPSASKPRSPLETLNISLPQETQVSFCCARNLLLNVQQASATMTAMFPASRSKEIIFALVSPLFSCDFCWSSHSLSTTNNNRPQSTRQVRATTPPTANVAHPACSLFEG